MVGGNSHRWTTCTARVPWVVPGVLVVVVVLGARAWEVPTGNLHLGKSAPPAYLLHWSNWHLWDLWH